MARSQQTISTEEKTTEKVQSVSESLNHGFNQPELPGIPPKPEVEKTTQVTISQVTDKKGDTRYVVYCNGHTTWEMEIETTRLKRIFNSLAKRGINVKFNDYKLKLTEHGKDNNNNI